MAPEVEKAAEKDLKRAFTPKVDIYAFGKVIVYLLTGNPDTELENIDSDLKPIIAKCLREDPSARPTATELLEEFGLVKSMTSFFTEDRGLGTICEHMDRDLVGRGSFILGLCICVPRGEAGGGGGGEGGVTPTTVLFVAEPGDGELYQPRGRILGPTNGVEFICTTTSIAIKDAYVP